MKPLRGGFTLVEVLIVLVILSVTLSIVIPYSGRSTSHLRLEQEGLNLQSAVLYVMDRANTVRAACQIVVDRKRNGYWLEQHGSTGEKTFEPIPGLPGVPHMLEKSVTITETTGFEKEDDREVLAFDPAQAWPTGRITIGTRESLITIVIDGVSVTIEETQPTGTERETHG